MKHFIALTLGLLALIASGYTQEHVEESAVKPRVPLPNHRPGSEGYGVGQQPLDVDSYYKRPQYPKRYQGRPENYNAFGNGNGEVAGTKRRGNGLSGSFSHGLRFELPQLPFDLQDFFGFSQQPRLNRGQSRKHNRGNVEDPSVKPRRPLPNHKNGFSGNFGQQPLDVPFNNVQPKPVLFDFGSGNHFGKGNKFGDRKSHRKTGATTTTSAPLNSESETTSSYSEPL
ncbi:uncharacterized protein LOC142226307 [Haematobia irritans]|uniref:uncharacterized protein LOC142226307 n=1 Tax=Haematobia irritans TaxID=7368 RepID=UPI003F509079